MLHGGSARDGWRRLARQHPDLVVRLEVIRTYHTSSQAFIGPPEVRAARMAALKEAFARATRILQEPDPQPLPQADSGAGRPPVRLRLSGPVAGLR